MSTATATDAAAAAAPAKGKKKLIIIIAAVAALVLAGGGGAGVYLMKKKAADAEAAEEGEGGGAHAAAKSGTKHDAKEAPVFVPLDPFTVNLADRDAERYAQVGITLEIDDAHLGDRIKSFMPAIRNRVLMAIADRTAGDLANREGKARLAETVRRETLRALGYEVDDEDDAAADDEAPPPKAAAKKKKRKAEASPIKAVHFSNFIIQ